MVGFARDAVEAVGDNWDNVQRLNEAAPTVDTKAITILTFIDNFDKECEGARAYYNRLSEMCHPNFSRPLYDVRRSR